jgi:hypothetical protein
MQITIFSTKGLSTNRRERIDAAVVAGGTHARGPHEGWIAVDPRGAFAYSSPGRMDSSDRWGSGQMKTRRSSASWCARRWRSSATGWCQMT